MKPPRLEAIIELQRMIFEQLEELDQVAPSEVDKVVRTIVAHLRGWRPQGVTPLGTLEPTEPVPCGVRR